MKRSNPPEGGPTHGLDLRVAQRLDIDVHDLDDRATPEPPAYGWYRTAEDVVFHVQVLS